MSRVCDAEPFTTLLSGDLKAADELVHTTVFVLGRVEWRILEFDAHARNPTRNCFFPHGVASAVFALSLFQICCEAAVLCGWRRTTMVT
jgi:hypothetical protein